MPAIENVPTNVIFGFLGVGKTSAILSCFDQKPAQQSWSVLVNEFGEIGIDGGIYADRGIAVKEIPGGCMCCAQGVPLQVAINRLLRETRPDRLLIESSGIGHPAGVLKTLQGEGFHGVLDLKAAVGLVDPEQLRNEAYLGNELFLQQLALADVLVANKADLASPEGLQAFAALTDRFVRPKSLVATTKQGRLGLDWLDHGHTDRSADAAIIGQTTFPADRWQSYSWRFPAFIRFDLDALKAWIVSLGVLRLKGVVNTSAGSFLLNYVSGALSVAPAGQAGETRLQIIDHQPMDDDARQEVSHRYEQAIHACVQSGAP